MENEQYVLFIVINDMKIFRDVISKLRKIEVKGFTVLDTMGSTNLYGNLHNYAAFMSSISTEDSKRYNKTIYAVVPCEEEAVKVMDEVEKIFNKSSSKVGKGVMFTVPIYSSYGIVGC